MTSFGTRMTSGDRDPEQDLGSIEAPPTVRRCDACLQQLSRRHRTAVKRFLTQWGGASFVKHFQLA